MLNCLKTTKFKLLLAMISLLVLTNTIQESYAKYISSASASSNFTIAQWTFKVNDQDVLADSDFSSTIVPVIDTNSNIREGFIAPTSTGHFDVIVDYSEVGVSFDETISVSYPNDSSVTDLVLTGYTLNGGPLVSITAGDEITLTHLLGSATSQDTFRFFVQWIDGTGETMDNDADTAASKDETTSLKVNINFIQRAN